MKKYIRIKLWKFSLLQASVPIIFILIFNAFTGFEMPLLFLLILCILGALGFAIFGAAIASWTLESVLEDGKIINVFDPFKRGPVVLSNAKTSVFNEPIFIVLKDSVTKSSARIPKPFWAEDPDLVKEVLDQVRKNVDVKTRK